MTPGPGVEPRPHWWEANALTTAPSLLPFSCAHVISTSLSIITIVIKLVGKICACGTSALTIRRETLQAMQVHLALAQSGH